LICWPKNTQAIIVTAKSEEFLIATAGPYKYKYI